MLLSFSFDYQYGMIVHVNRSIITTSKAGDRVDVGNLITSCTR